MRPLGLPIHVQPARWEAFTCCRAGKYFADRKHEVPDGILQTQASHNLCVELLDTLAIVQPPNYC